VAAALERRDAACFHARVDGSDDVGGHGGRDSIGARRREREAGSDEMEREWSKVALAIARTMLRPFCDEAARTRKTADGVSPAFGKGRPRGFLASFIRHPPFCDLAPAK